MEIEAIKSTAIFLMVSTNLPPLPQTKNPTNVGLDVDNQNTWTSITE